MNRGRGRQLIFHGDTCYLAFFETLMEARERFGLEVDAYCLMSSHYHLLLKTPNANLSRCMRHINGLYTSALQPFKTDRCALISGAVQSDFS